MPFSIVVDGAERRIDSLPLSALDDLERSTGKTLDQLVATARGLAAIAALLVGDEVARGLRLDELQVSRDDRPVEYNESAPSLGGRTADRFVVAFARPPWCWPPDVTLRQSLRHLQLLSDAFDDDE